jgi:hypothetical protein
MDAVILAGYLAGGVPGTWAQAREMVGKEQIGEINRSIHDKVAEE